MSANIISGCTFKFTLNAGLGVRGSLRNALHTLRHHGCFVEWAEGSGFLSRPFFIHADDRATNAITEWLSQLEAARERG
jgi:hypothetical protein